MPISPENRARYPKNWKQIRTDILERAANKCEQCGLDNYAVILRAKDGSFRHFGVGDDYADARQIAADKHWSMFGDENWPRFTIIVLTISHTNHIIENVSPDNLKALCQRCHLIHDAKYHAANAQITRRRKNPTPQLFVDDPGASELMGF